MKYLLLITTILISSLCFAEDSLPEPITDAGKNLDLEAVGELFAKSKNLEEFEIALNTQGNDVNNIDLNGDGEVNYIKVEEKVEKNTHVIFLRVPLEKDDVQDVATIEIERKEDGSVDVQIVGDEELYGENYIIEHIISAEEVKIIETEVERLKETEKSDLEGLEEVEEVAPTEEVVTESSTEVSSTTTVTYVYVGYAYYPYYSPYHSPYYYGYYPGWYHPYHPVSHSIYVSRTRRYRRKSYRRTSHRRSSRARSVHKSHHRSSKNSSHNYKKQSSNHNQAKKNNSSTSNQQKSSSSQQKSNSNSSQQKSNSSQQKSNSSSQQKKQQSPSSSPNKSRGGSPRRR
jgi:hypothetical protein